MLGSTLRTRTREQKAKLVREFTRHALPRFENGELRPVLARTFSLLEAGEAHDVLQRGEVAGKLVLELDKRG